MPLWRGYDRRAKASVARDSDHDPALRANRSGATTIAANQATGTRRTNTDGISTGSWSFGLPDVDALTSVLQRRFEPLLHPETVLQRPERVEALSDDAFDVLSNARRRRVLIHLFDTDEPATLGGLSRSIVAWENDISERDVTSQQRKRVYTALRQNHLPKMNRAGVIDYDADRGSIELTDEATRLRTYLDVPIRRWNWERYYLLLGRFWCGVSAAIWTGVVPMDPLSRFALTGLAGLSIVCSALTQIYARQLGAEY